MTALVTAVLARKGLVVCVWAVLAAGGLALTESTTARFVHNFALPGREGFVANRKIEQIYGSGGILVPYAFVVTLPASQTVGVPEDQAELSSIFSAEHAQRYGGRIVSYVSTGDKAFASRDGRTTFALFFPPTRLGVTIANLREARAIVTERTVAGAPVHVTGLRALVPEASRASNSGVLLETLIGAAGALIVLLAVFGSALAVLPLMMALATIPTTFLLVRGVEFVTSVTYIVQYVVVFVGLGVAIDYSLLVVMRWREERARAVSNESAVLRAMERAGRTLAVSGAAVAVGLTSLVVLPIPFMHSVGYGSLLIPLISVAAAVTLLPILLATVAPRLDSRMARRGADARRGWERWGMCVVRYRWVAAGIAIVLVVALIFGATQMHIGIPRASAIGGEDADVGLLELEHAGVGSGVLTPTEILVPTGQVDTLVGRLTRVRGVAAVVAPVEWTRGKTRLVDILPTGDSSESSGATLTRVIAATRSVPGALVGGAPAYARDLSRAVFGRWWLLLGYISTVTVAILAWALKSVILPLKAVLVNAVSICTAWGAVALVWQKGWGSDLIWGIPASGAVQAWIPLMIFAFLWGLSIDYEVIVLSRMREEYDRTGSTDAAVISGIHRTGRLVTSSALILCLALVSMSFAPDPQVKVLGTGLAAGILFDATVIRSLLVPAIVAIFGRYNWVVLPPRWR